MHAAKSGQKWPKAAKAAKSGHHIWKAHNSTSEETQRQSQCSSIGTKSKIGRVDRFLKPVLNKTFRKENLQV
jgi:hypothetical protein